MAHNHYNNSEKTWTDRAAGERAGAQYGPAPDGDIQAALRRNGFHHAQTSLGGLGIAGHLVGFAGTMAPLIISEFVTDPQKWRRATRLTAIGTAIAYEGLHTLHELGRRRAMKAKLEECEGRNS
jgi:hypothetical protein